MAWHENPIGLWVQRLGAKTDSIPNKELLSKVSTASNIPALDAVRGIAASMVVVAHTLGPRQLGSMAVAIFSVLSGFLITWLLLGNQTVPDRYPYETSMCPPYPANLSCVLCFLDRVCRRCVVERHPNPLGRSLVRALYHGRATKEEKQFTAKPLFFNSKEAFH
jgi:hypothetical protein